MKVKCGMCGDLFDFDFKLLDPETFSLNPNLQMVCAECGNKRNIELCHHLWILSQDTMLCYKCGWKKPRSEQRELDKISIYSPLTK